MMKKFNVTLFALIAAITVLFTACDEPKDSSNSVHTKIYKNGQEIVFATNNGPNVSYKYGGKIEDGVFMCMNFVAIADAGPVTSFEEINTAKGVWANEMKIKENNGYIVKITHVYGSYYGREFRMMVNFMDDGSYEVKFQEIEK